MSETLIVITMRVRPATKTALAEYKKLKGLTHDQLILYLLDRHIAREVKQMEILARR